MWAWSASGWFYRGTHRTVSIKNHWIGYQCHTQLNGGILYASVYAVLQYNGYDIKSEPLGFLPKPIDHSGQAKGGAMVFSFTTQVDAV